MALKILQLQNKLDIAHRSLSELEAKEADFETRAAELEARIPECRDAQSQAECDEAIEKLDADKAEFEEAKANLQREIEGLEAELRELDKPVDEEKIEKVGIGQTKKRKLKSKLERKTIHNKGDVPFRVYPPCFSLKLYSSNHEIQGHAYNSRLSAANLLIKSID